jgi:Mg-chelatase subunit ChlI
MPLDPLVVFSDSPGDCANRGNLITPLRDRASPQLITHHPLACEDGMPITAQESRIERGGEVEAALPGLRRERAAGARTSRKDVLETVLSGIGED